MLIVNNDLLLTVMILSTFTNIIMIKIIVLCRSTKSTNEIEYQRMTRNLTKDYHLEQMKSQ